MRNPGEECRLPVRLPPPHQLGIVVQDMERAIKFYSSVLGWGPFQIREMKLEGFVYQGRTGSAILNVAYAWVGPLQIELIQVLEGETIHTEFLRQHGEGMQHIGFRIDDLDAVLQELAKEGIEAVFHHSLPHLAFAYVDTNKVCGVTLEFVQRKEQ